MKRGSISCITILLRYFQKIRRSLLQVSNQNIIEKIFLRPRKGRKKKRRGESSDENTNTGSVSHTVIQSNGNQPITLEQRKESMQNNPTNGVNRFQSVWREFILHKKERQMIQYKEFLFHHPENTQRVDQLNSSATILQCKWRFLLSHRVLIALRVEKEEDEFLKQEIIRRHKELILDTHAFRIQFLFQMNLAKKICHRIRCQQKREQDYVVRVQSLVRGFLKRKEWTKVKRLWLVNHRNECIVGNASGYGYLNHSHVNNPNDRIFYEGWDMEKKDTNYRSNLYHQRSVNGNDFIEHNLGQRQYSHKRVVYGNYGVSNDDHLQHSFTHNPDKKDVKAQFKMKGKPAGNKPPRQKWRKIRDMNQNNMYTSKDSPWQKKWDPQSKSFYFRNSLNGKTYGSSQKS